MTDEQFEVRRGPDGWYAYVPFRADVLDFGPYLTRWGARQQGRRAIRPTTDSVLREAEDAIAAFAAAKDSGDAEAIAAACHRIQAAHDALAAQTEEADRG